MRFARRFEMQPSRRFAKLFLLLTTFLEFAGIGLIIPVLPFIVVPYVAREDAALVVALLASSYSLTQLIAVPLIGSLSDRYGRRPVLLISIFGTAVGYLVFGVGGALWVLFLGRIIDGFTGGNVSTIFAAAADLTEEKERTQFFGYLGALHGLGIVLGPVLGALIYSLTNSVIAPVLVAAGVTVINLLWGYFAMPESLPASRRDIRITSARFNPIQQFAGVFALRQIRPLLVSIFLWQFGFAILISNLSYLTEDRLGWQPNLTSLLFSISGLTFIVVQLVFVKPLLARLGERRMSVAGFGLMVIGFVLLAIVALRQVEWLIFVATIITSSGNGLLNASMNGLLSNAVGAGEQGRAQGANQSVEALARVIGPVSGGWLYAGVGSAAAYLSAAAGLALGMAVATSAVSTAHARQDELATQQSSAD